MKVSGKHGGLSLHTVNNKPCKHCGVGKVHHVYRIPVSAVSKITQDTEQQHDSELPIPNINEPALTPSKNQASLLLFLLNSICPLTLENITKGLFIFTQAVPPHRFLETILPYEFAPTSSGPNAPAIEEDLRSLSKNGYITISFTPPQQGSQESTDYYSLTEDGNRTAQRLANNIKDEQLRFLHKVREFVLRIKASKLLHLLSNKYPCYVIPDKEKVVS
jgi:hypothetical protein